MAEKEERIVFLKTKPKGECPCQIDKDYCKETCWVKGKCSLGITRQEAIERIAKAICANEDEYVDCEQCEFNGPEDCKRYYRNNWLYTAEAALNALLGEK